MILDVESPFRETALLAVQIPNLSVTAYGRAAECVDSDETQSRERQLIGKRRSQRGGNGRRCARFGRTAGGRRARSSQRGRLTVGVDVTERRPDGTLCQPREVAEVVSRGGCFTAHYWNGATHVVTLTRSDRKTDHDQHPHAELTTVPRSWADDPEWDATHRTLDEQDSNPAVLAAVQVGIEALDEGFTDAQRVRRYALLGNTRATAFDVLTPTDAMKRRSIHCNHEVEIENLYKVSGAS
jgi:hypothetical protein